MDQGTAMWLLAAAMGALSYLLQRKDAAQEKQMEALEKQHKLDLDGHQKQIALLFIKHDEDAKALQELRERVVGNHYERPLIDAKFEKMERTFSEGFKDLGEKMSALTDTLLKNLIASKAQP